MTLSAGTKLGPYEIVAPLGAGGMGEVYRARDAKLNRDIAIKVLPERLADDATALSRFEREARSVAALSHPNILSIFDFGREGSVAYAVMELLEGETLRQRLSVGALPVRKTLEYTIQIAHGLAAAHEKGIVHRDLKPENVFITPDGRVKILDFGLAKVAMPESDQTSSPTAAAPTEPGTVMGTVGYMSPEQVRGKLADQRSDIFSLGSILYEMLSGQRAFRGDSAAETMAAIAQKDPPALTQPEALVAPGLEGILRHCLEKSADERFQSARDLAFALSSMLGSSGRHGAVDADRAVPGKWRLFLAAAALVIAAGAFGLGWWLKRVPSPQKGAPHGTFVQLTDQPGVERDPDLSPDGKSVLYVSDASGNDDVYLLRIGGRNPIDLTPDSPADDNDPKFSPDGSQIAFRSERQGGGIFVMGATGESVRRVTDFGYNPSWSPDGREIVVSTVGFAFPTERVGTGALWAVSLASGTRRPILQVGDAVAPSWSPHGRRIAFWGLRGQSGQRDLWTVPADGSAVRGGAVGVTDDSALDFGPRWSPDGRLLYFSSDRGGTTNLWRIPIDETSGRVLGEPEPVTAPSSWTGSPSLSRDGNSLAFSSLEWRSTLLRIAFDPAREQTVGSAISMLRSTLPIRDHALSPDGQWVAFTSQGTHPDLFVVQTDGSSFRRLTDDAFRDRGPAWSPDGQELVFYSDRSGPYELWSIRPDGSGLRQLTHLKSSTNMPVWSPDGSRIATLVMASRTWQVLDATTGTTVRDFTEAVRGSTRFWPLAWSSDGGSLLGAMWSSDTGAIEGLGVCLLSTGKYEEIYKSNLPSFLWPFWLRDGHRVVFRDKRGISLLDSRSMRSHRLVPVSGYMSGLSLGVSRDDRWITYTETATEGDVWLMQLGGGAPTGGR